MLRREGRVDHPHMDAAHAGHARPVKVRHWERVVLLVVAVAGLIAGAVFGLDTLIDAFR